MADVNMADTLEVREVRARVALTPKQWATLERQVSNRKLAYKHDLHDPDVSDLALFQIFPASRPVAPAQVAPGD